MHQRIVTNLWFDTQAEAAARFYTSVFPNSRIVNITHYTEGSPGTPGAVMTVTWEMHGQRFTGINGGPDFKFSEAISLLVECDDQQEIDRLWTTLTADGGEESMCGWLKDKYGLSWQIVPSNWDTRFQEAPGNEGKMKAMLDAMYQMKKLDIQTLEAAYNQG
jgi:predicted 3-demethylubiquinone-9 3-methyltransferase (glyoxalase superfamily)